MDSDKPGRPASVMSVEVYSLLRRAEFLLNNAVDAKDYQRAVAEVRKWGFGPEQIPHQVP